MANAVLSLVAPRFASSALGYLIFDVSWILIVMGSIASYPCFTKDETTDGGR